MVRTLFFAILLSALAACSNKHDCKNTNRVLEEYGPTQREYKAELIKQLQRNNAANIHYLIDRYREVNGKPFMNVYVQSDSICAQMLIDIKNPNKLKHFKTVKGISYSGTEITGLQYQTDSINGEYNFVFEEGMINGKKQ